MPDTSISVAAKIHVVISGNEIVLDVADAKALATELNRQLRVLESSDPEYPGLKRWTPWDSPLQLWRYPGDPQLSRFPSPPLVPTCLGD